MNRKRAHKGTSRFKGVSRRKDRDAWRATIWVGGKQHHIGDFDTEQQAALAFDAHAREQFGELARTNFAEVGTALCPFCTRAVPSNHNHSTQQAS